MIQLIYHGVLKLSTPRYLFYISKIDMSLTNATRAIGAAGATLDNFNEARVDGNNYFGNPRFIYNCITQYNKLFNKTRGVTQMAGQFGKVYRIEVDGIPYFVKGIFNQVERKVRLEIETAIDLTRKIPEFVSKCKGARYGKDGGYIIFEGLNGMDLEQFMINYPPNPVDASLYESIYSKIKAAQEAINAAGYVHQDIKPANIFVELDKENNEPLRCVLIDFGLTRPIGYPWTGQGTPLYMPDNLWQKIKHRKFLKTNVSSPTHNETSVEIIRRQNFKLRNLAAPAPVPNIAELRGDDNVPIIRLPNAGEREIAPTVSPDVKMSRKSRIIPKIVEDDPAVVPSDVSKGGRKKYINKTKKHKNKSRKSRSS